ncbi:MAG: Asp-tRNA(Asn)/Glu-tRNA(Gln) amidotransferase subunit GatB [Thiobacillaceae bacterium]
MPRSDANWEIVIGLEVHTQLSTRSKIFSASSTVFGAAPNTQANAVDIALPGVLPVLNKGAVERAIKFGLAVGATINRVNVFDRKHYFYPDLPKGYQISQLAKPIVEHGVLNILVDGVEKSVRLTRAHMEEDAGKSLHEDFHGMSGIDLNRAGTPLLEIVSEPDMRSAEEAVAYARALRTLVTWIGICDGNMQEGSFRVDANVSVRPKGSEKLGTRREIKNLNSFKFLQQAIEYEAHWQIETLEDGGRVEQATVLFDPDTGETRMMRSKEDAHDYRYFPDPDLLPVKLDEDWIEAMRAALPELPATMQTRFQRDYGVSAYDAATLTSSLGISLYFENMVSTAGKDLAKACANWIMGELAGRLNREGIDIVESPVSPEQLAGIVIRVADNTINNKIAKDLFDEMWVKLKAGGDYAWGAMKLPRLEVTGTGSDLASIDDIIEARGLKQMSDSGELEKIVDEVLAANSKSVEEYRAGKDKAFNALVGQVMKRTRGKANPQQVNDLLKARLGS